MMIRYVLASQRFVRAGFTLVEILVVVVIIAILTGLAAGGYIAYARRGHEAATQALVRQLDMALKERIEAFNAGIVSLDINDFKVPAGGTSASPDNSAVGKRARVLARLDSMRKVFPQRFKDFLPGPQTGSNQILGGIGTDSTIGRATGRNVRAEVAAMVREFEKATGQTGTNASLPSGHDDVNTEGSECLYLILGIPVEGGTFSLDQIPGRFIDDTDGDGLLEFVDAWGNPLAFYRWPVDYVAYLMEGTGQLPRSLLRTTDPNNLSATVDSNGVDPDGVLGTSSWFGNTNLRQQFFEQASAELSTTNRVPGGFYRLHWPYAIPSSSSDAIDITTSPVPGTVRVYPLMPLIMSAGPDGEFGLLVEDTGSIPGVGANYPGFIGARVTGDTSRVRLTEDNILNYDLTELER
ncbi:hypothetical protein Pan216_11350 [Planctomycetes bacterium Pan216]|uniref:Prepilin-type N-terminal cleavage/methylation domain-containing protein n=1 Tax=Kolteria novifilia TaxID=2527975 RepID=A0A518AZZ9_9BACT|nr:hypothetical protein Pan216_11350 [Planctomycetes bacterium Pan216]